MPSAYVPPAMSATKFHTHTKLSMPSTFLKLKLLKLQFHKIIRLKLHGRRWVIQYSQCDVTLADTHPDLAHARPAHKQQ